MPATMATRFRGYLPIVIDIETGGFNVETDAVLELAAVSLVMDETGDLHPNETYHYHVLPFEGANLDPAALEFTGIKPFHPLRGAITETTALTTLFKAIRQELKTQNCHRAVLVGHNAAFDLGFLHAAAKRTGLKKNPFHPFTTFDTACLSALAFGQTVLARAVECAGIPFDHNEAHSALYDAERTTELFCHIVNRWHALERVSSSSQ